MNKSSDCITDRASNPCLRVDSYIDSYIYLHSIVYRNEILFFIVYANES